MAGFTESGQDNLLMLNRSSVKAKGLHGMWWVCMSIYLSTVKINPREKCKMCIQ